MSFSPSTFRSRYESVEGDIFGMKYKFRIEFSCHAGPTSSLLKVFLAALSVLEEVVRPRQSFIAAEEGGGVGFWLCYTRLATVSVLAVLLT